jgi:esterase/lipase superfamily enzyme
VDLNRRHLALYSPAIGGELPLVAYGHYGRPLLVFPSQQGHATDYESNGMVEAIAWLIEAGRVKVYCVESFDSASWQAGDVPLEERARRHGLFEDFVVNQVAPFIHADCGGPREIMLTGCSFGAYHSANFALKRADLFPLAICQSGVYDVEVVGWGEPGEAVYFNNPVAYVRHLHGDHLEWLRGHVSILLVCGQGQWEDTTGSLDSTKHFAHVLGEKGLRVELDLWGHDVPHDWPSWRAQIAHHLPRFC